MDPEKVELIANRLPPTNVKEILVFLGLPVFYAYFKPTFSDIAELLYALTKKDTIWNWTPESQKPLKH